MNRGSRIAAGPQPRFGRRFIAAPFRHHVMPCRDHGILLHLVQRRAGHDFDQVDELDAEDIEVGMPFA